MMKAKIFEIKRFAVHDGDGIRTTVFFKGCPLKCVWCHNPEGIDFKPQLAYYENKCTGCGKCASVCPSGAHGIKAGHIFEREKCICCGVCADTCYANALTLYGKDASAKELIPILLEDKDFYDTSGGGVTLSGGECLIQADFCAELLKQLKENGIHTAVDTCGFVPRENIDKVIPYTDIFLYDIKAIDEDVHKRCTGRSNKLILENLKYIDGCGKSIEIRIPYVPNYNDSQINKIAALLKTLKNVKKVKLLPYHNYAASKYSALGMDNTLPDLMPQSCEISRLEKLFD
jgi:pyruvate formate lyase activating enzyme